MPLLEFNDVTNTLNFGFSSPTLLVVLFESLYAMIPFSSDRYAGSAATYQLRDSVNVEFAFVIWSLPSQNALYL
ncbi:MAG: hypothetical protein EB153_09445, partial [Nitrosopumilaceae archaeon]|nr:hypothetical protein [Nitrosopumilaceae archaeon]